MMITNKHGQNFATKRVEDFYGKAGWIAGQLEESGAALKFIEPQFFPDVSSHDSQGVADNYITDLSRHNHGTCACGNPAQEYTDGECQKCQQARITGEPTTAAGLADMFRQSVRGEK